MEHFAPVVTSPRTSPHQNLTGAKRIVKDLTATIHTSIQQWNNIHIHGVDVLKSITAMKFDDSFPEGLQELCDTLEKDVDRLDQVVSNLKLSFQQMTSAVSLHRGPEKLFKTWGNERFVEIAQLIYEVYKKEADLKRKILENVAHDYQDSWKMLHLAAWVHQPMIPHDLNVSLESLLIETGHR
ncbi:cyclin-dependent kinase 2-interacting protein [Fopius arisanus]|uniref:Cyclin-dependent kinase 2-interacting protein n=1 Tax=Fopius arisanus TaxID=64838 RepID=A0A9R1U749_9HYME|nr:PREDICTED: cyclin-dependent kinase 2-interacting protein-like [Fopius arisanus]